MNPPAHKTVGITLLATCFLIILGISACLVKQYVITGPDPIDAMLDNYPRLKSTPATQANVVFQHANTAFKHGNFDTALQLYDHALALDPTLAAAHYNAGLTHKQIGNRHNALHHFARASQLDKNHTRAYLNSGSIYLQEGNIDRALQSYVAAAATEYTDKKFDDVIIKICATIDEHYKKSYSAPFFDEIMSRIPRVMKTVLALASEHIKRGNNLIARELLLHLNTLAPQSAALFLGIGQTYERENDPKTALQWYQKAVRLAPDNPAIHVALSGMHQMLGDYEQGFAEYEWRWQLSNLRNDTQFLKWDGSSPAGKTIVILPENGFGDIFQFMRFARSLKDQGARVVVRASKVLTPFFKNCCEYIDEVVQSGDPLPTHDGITSVQSLPALLGTTMNTVPQPPYFTPDPARNAYWKEYLSTTNTFNIGICWQSGGDLSHIPQGRRSVPLAMFETLAKLPGVQLYSLQKGDDALAQRAKLPEGMKVIDFGQSFDKEHGAFMDTAALMQHLDLIISVDTSVGHLAGALNVPTLLLLPYHPDPRWMLERTDSPWYPSITLFRQETPQQWEPVVARVVQKVQRLSNS